MVISVIEYSSHLFIITGKSESSFINEREFYHQKIIVSFTKTAVRAQITGLPDDLHENPFILDPFYQI
jgi:hypothetical protein